MLKHSLCRWLAISCLALFVTACGGGGGSGGSNSDTGSGTGTPSSSPSAPPSSSPSPSPGVTRRVDLSWNIPTTRTDGSSIATSAISAYRVFYTRDGSTPNEDTTVVINSGTTTSTSLSLALAGTYTFAITAIDNNGSESALSNPVSITIN